MSLHRFDASALAATPWKNGGGVTREIACQPPGAGMDAFDWRLSIAEIAAAGPFSSFPGVDRVITLLDGAGVLLRSRDGAISHRLAIPLAPFAFPGEAAIDAQLLGGGCRDLNVMTRRAACRAQVLVIDSDRVLPAAADGMLLAVQGRWQAAGAGGEPQSLAPSQGLWWHDAAAAWQLRAQDGAAALLAVLIDRAGP